MAPLGAAPCPTHEISHLKRISCAYLVAQTAVSRQTTYVVDHVGYRPDEGLKRTSASAAAAVAEDLVQYVIYHQMRNHATLVRRSGKQPAVVSYWVPESNTTSALNPGVFIFIHLPSSKFDLSGRNSATPL